MTDADLLRESLASLEVNGEFTEGVLVLSDGTNLCFSHRVGERTAKATGTDASLAARLLSKIALFRLNPRHLDVQFEDGSRWEALFGQDPA